MKDNITYFENTNEYLEYLQSKPLNEGWGSVESFNEGSDWSGGSFEQAIEYASNGWKEGKEKLAGNMRVLKRNGKGKGMIKDVAGGFPCIGSYLANMPNCMNRRSTTDASRKPIIDIYICPVMHAGGSADKMIMLGAAIADFIDTCESVGYSATLTASMIAKSNGSFSGHAGSIFPIKKSGEALDVEKMVYYVAHPSFLRKLGFKDFCTKLSYNELGSGKGRQPEHEIHAKLAEKDSLMFITSANVVNGINNAIDAKAWVMSQVTKQRPELIDSIAA